MRSQILNYILFFWVVLFLHGCCGVKDSVEVVASQPSRTSLGEVVILNQNKFYPQLREALIREGFTVPPFTSNSEITVKSQESDTKFENAAARIGIRHMGTFSAFNPCIINRSAAHFKDYELEIIDLKENETLMRISYGGWTENCPMDLFTLGHSTTLFKDLANSFAKNYEKIDLTD